MVRSCVAARTPPQIILLTLLRLVSVVRSGAPAPRVFAATDPAFVTRLASASGVSA
jgi:hypothetical protein